MIEYENGVVVMDLVDLEQCNFDHDLFDFELRASFVDCPVPLWPIAILVNFAGGAVVTADTSDETLARMKEANERFQVLKERIIDEC